MTGCPGDGKLLEVNPEILAIEQRAMKQREMLRDLTPRNRHERRAAAARSKK